MDSSKPTVARPSLRWLALAVGALTLFWLGYIVGRVQNIGTVASLYRDADVARYTLSRGGVTLQYEKAGGDGKPYIQNDAGLSLLDLSDWDTASRITVDGTSFALVRIYPTSAVDYGRYRLAETLQGDGWQLEREVTLRADGSVLVQHTFIARRAIQHVDLTLAYAHQYFNNVSIASGAVTATASALAPAQFVIGAHPRDAYRVTVTPRGSLQPMYRAGAISPFGPSSFVAEYTTTNPQQDRRTVLGTEVIRVQHA
ncbi:MAG TPA: hypothetical protein VMV93_14665 [Chloroflexota bacterium]|nr:hypothetical protein [Chloroflexota bacterium]